MSFDKMPQSIVLNNPTVTGLCLAQYRQNYSFHNFHSKEFHSLMKDCAIRVFFLLVYQFASGRGAQEENEIILNDNDFSIPVISSSRVVVILEKKKKFEVSWNKTVTYKLKSHKRYETER